MFRQRLLTSLVLVPLILASIWFAPSSVLGAMVLTLMLIGAYEWAKLVPLKGIWRVAFLGLPLIVTAVFYAHPLWLVLAAPLMWGVVAVMVVTYPASTRWWGHPALVMAWGSFFLPLWALSLKSIYEQPQGRSLLLCLLFFIWAADVGAYLVGRKWGRNKLLYTVSPGKTMEGAMGGMLMACLVLYLSQMGFGLAYGGVFALMALLLVPISILGDLFISMLKRRVALKDTGKILPGHGGILDRFDSLIAAAPFYFLFLTLFFQAG